MLHFLCSKRLSFEDGLFFYLYLPLYYPPMMKKGLLLITAIFAFIALHAQPQGKPTTEIFADYHYYNTKDTSLSTRSGFGLNRAFLGYIYQPDRNITATIIVNVGTPSELPAGSKERRYAYFREASVAWSNERLSLSFGMTTTRSLIFQQKFYGKRYVADNFEAINGFSTVADLGFSADYIINDVFKIDLTLMNGEGYSNLHIDNSIKTSLGLNITPVEKGVIRLYADFDHPAGVWQQLYIGFIGYKTDKVMIGGEMAYKTNPDKIEGKDSWGISATGSVKTSEKTEIFGRYDYCESNKLSEVTSWSYKSDRQFIVAGFQYMYNEYLRMALDYQGTYPLSKNMPHADGIFLNVHFRF